jgi:hypothetical protein
MANALFYSARNGFQGSHATRVDLDADDIGVMFVDHADDTPVPATDDFLDDIASAGRVPALASCPNLASKTIGVVAVGVFDSVDPTFTALTGDQVESLIVFKDTNDHATADLLAWFDVFTSGMPLTPNGGDVTVNVNASGWWTV